MSRIDKDYCMSHYLAFRYVQDEGVNFFPGLEHRVFHPRPAAEKTAVRSADEMDAVIREKLAGFVEPGKTGILLSGGQDSAILASYLPKGTKAFTFKCVADGAIDETVRAAKYAEIGGLEHVVVEMHWEDFERLTPELIEHDGVPFHSIEVQLAKAAKLARSMGIEKLVIGESADLVFGGMDQLLEKDRTVEEFQARYTFTDPRQVLRNPVDVSGMYERYRLPGGMMDFLKFMDDVFSNESSSSYMHALGMCGISYLDPYSYMCMADPLDLKRVRNGEPKYLVRELFAKRYPQMQIPDKIPMPRAMNQWFAGWEGPKRHEFVPGCHAELTGDQRWQCWCLEQFLNRHDPE